MSSAGEAFLLLAEAGGVGVAAREDRPEGDVALRSRLLAGVFLSAGSGEAPREPGGPEEGARESEADPGYFGTDDPLRTRGGCCPC